MWLSGRSCFSHTNSSNFQQPLQLLHLRYMAENLQVTYMCNFHMLFQLMLTKFYNSKLFMCLLKVDPVINYCKRPISLCKDKICGTNFKGVNFFSWIKEESGVLDTLVHTHLTLKLTFFWHNLIGLEVFCKQ